MSERESRIEEVNVGLGDRSYAIQVGPGLIDHAGALMKPLLAQPRVFVVTDENVAGHYLDRVLKALDAAAVAHHHHVLPAGENTKSFPHLERLLDAMLDARCERATTVVALGGGVIGDLAGFAASVLLRGVDFVQIPTTLLAQVDSSVGGKTGINTRHGKNLVGSFHQPRLVLADTAVLDSLPRRELLAGYAEVAKYGLIDDAGFFAWLEHHGKAVVDGDAAARRKAVVTSCQSKARVVGADEREAGSRALLNLGHTFAHALEAETGFGPELLHGEAVSVGMVMAFDLSVRMKLCPPEDLARVRAHLAGMGLPVAPRQISNRAWEAGRLIDHMAGDKKVRDGQLTFVLARGIGRAFLCREVPSDLLRATVEGAIAA